MVKFSVRFTSQQCGLPLIALDLAHEDRLTRAALDYLLRDPVIVVKTHAKFLAHYGAISLGPALQHRQKQLTISALEANEVAKKLQIIQLSFSSVFLTLKIKNRLQLFDIFRTYQQE